MFSTLVKILSFLSRIQVKTKKKGLQQKLECFCPQNEVKTKRKGVHRNLGLNLTGICGTYSRCQALFRLFNQRSNLDGGR